MNMKLQQIIREHSSPLEPQTTGQAEQLQRLDGIKAVLFDIYGTLLISGSGDVGTAMASSRSAACAQALLYAGMTLAEPEATGLLCSNLLAQTIKADHELMRAAGVEYPEVDIRAIWQRVLHQLADQQLSDQSERIESLIRSEQEVAELATHFEMLTNPVWPMPGALACLETINMESYLLGIISNAQFFTKTLFPVLFEKSLDELGCEVYSFSYEHKQAKPGLFLYEHSQEQLKAHSIVADEVLYIGNDMLNDITPAQRLGFRTALFAGDARSLRLRENDPRVAETKPDLVITSLLQILECLG